MNRLSCILASLCFVFVITGITTAQDAIFYKFPDGVEPVIDGFIDPLWSYVDAHFVELYVENDVYTDDGGGVPSLGMVSWRAAWNDNYIFVIVSVQDDEFYPAWVTGEDEWMSDRVEVYFDVNDILDDGGGPVNTEGHYQIAPYFHENEYQVSASILNGYSGGHAVLVNISYGYYVRNPEYVFEYAIEISDLLDKNSNPLNPSAGPVIGFDLGIIDRDNDGEGRKIAVWKNTTDGYSWDNMNTSGKVLFSNEKVGRADATFNKFPDGCAPVIDGTKDFVWENVEVHNVSKSHWAEQPTLNKATWQAAWNDTSIFILIEVDDDDFYPMWESDDNQWMSDKPEIYFDVNNELKDEGGPENKAGHYQIAPWFYDELYTYKETGYQMTGQNNDVYATVAYRVDDPDYVYEYAINIEDFRDENGTPLNPHYIDMIGFDVTVVDRDAGDEARKRALWQNTGAIDESWYNMDDCGLVSFSTESAVNLPVPEIRLKGKNLLICLDSGMYSYSWYYEDQLLSGETNQFCRINEHLSGNYYVDSYHGNQCKTRSDPFNFTAKSATLKSGEPLIEVYPVPNTGNFTLSMISEESGRAIINIRDYTGTIIKSLIIDINAGAVSQEISIADIPKGVYIMDIIFNNITYYRRLLIN